MTKPIFSRRHTDLKMIKKVSSLRAFSFGYSIACDLKSARFYARIQLCAYALLAILSNESFCGIFTTLWQLAIFFKAGFIRRCALAILHSSSLKKNFPHHSFPSSFFCASWLLKYLRDKMHFLILRLSVRLLFCGKRSMVGSMKTLGNVEKQLSWKDTILLHITNHLRWPFHGHCVYYTVLKIHQNCLIWIDVQNNQEFKIPELQ